MTEMRITAKHGGNLYDNVCVDIEAAHRDFVRNDKAAFKRRYLYTTALLVKSGLWKRLVDSGFIRDWFDEFNNYWISYLGYRPLNLHDFFYLHSHYRTKFQDIAIIEGADAHEFMRAWQCYENIYLTFGSVYKYALSPLNFFRYRKYIHNAEYILEYGCGIAPMTYSTLKYGNFKKCTFIIADIRQFTYHFAKFRLAPFRNVFFVDLEPGVLPEFSNQFGVVFLTAVLEHLPNPLEVARHLYKNMKDGSYLIFDYIKSEGGGLDTVQSSKERKQVLDFIEENFKLVEGKIDKNNSMGVTVVRKK